MTLSDTKLGGIAFLVSVVVLASAFMLIAARGQLRGVSAAFMGVEGIGRDAIALRTLMKATAIYGVLHIIGFSILASTSPQQASGRWPSSPSDSGSLLRLPG